MGDPFLLPETTEPDRRGIGIHRKRLIGMTFGFFAGFAIIALLARATALGTQGPWFSASVSTAIYSATFVGGTILVISLAAVAVMQATMAGREVRALDLRIALLRGAGVGAMARGGIDLDQDIDQILEDVLAQPDGNEGTTLVAIRREGHDSLEPVPAVVARGRSDVVLRELSRVREGLRNAGSRLAGAVAGPITMGIAFLAIAGPMLPGADWFAAEHFQLNTMLILFLGYGWPFLVAWAAAALASGQVQEGKDR